MRSWQNEYFKDEKSVEVLFVDFGDVAVVRLLDVRALEDTFASVAPFAVRAALAEVSVLLYFFCV